MINIAHPPVTTKPPLSSKYVAGRGIVKKLQQVEAAKNEVKSSEKNITVESGFPVHKDVLDSEKVSSGVDETIRDLEKNLERINPGNDCNQNVIQPDSSSFQQLCNMINDLELNMSIDDTIVYKNLDTRESSFEFEKNRDNTKYFDQDQPEKDGSRNMCISNGSTYEDIMSFLGTLEKDTEITELCVTKDRNKKTESKCLSQYTDSLREEHATVLLQLEDRDATIRVLKSELKSERKIACEKLEKLKKDGTTELQEQKTKYQGIVKRHQKFIEQLITEKKDLTEKCNALATRIKESEAKQQRELKCALDRHAVELQRARELCAASEKIRRERWLEAKTSKIKEMTVKGLEPELRSMVDQHQQEIQDIRSNHMKELQDVELRTIRRSNQQLEQLRIELTASNDKIVANEREALRVRFQEKFNEQETVIQVQQRKFFEELQMEKKRFADEQARRDMERDSVVKQTASQFNEKTETLVRQHQIDKRMFEESLQAEREIWIENYRRQQNSKFEIAQARIMDECNRERDRQIELAISRLEKEASDMKANLQKSWENKLRCLKEKYDSELYENGEQIDLFRVKLTNAQRKIEEHDKLVTINEEKLRRLNTDLNDAKQIIARLTMERDQSKSIARQEIESEKRELEDKIASLYRELTQNNANRDSLMAQLYSRIKLIVTQKDLAIKNVTREANETRDKCDHLEKLLDQQRKEYVFKSL